MATYDEYRIEELSEPISAMEDSPTLDATALKNWFDASPNQIKDAFNTFVGKIGEDKDAFEAWKAEIQSMNLDEGAAAALAVLLLHHNDRHAFGADDAIITDRDPTSGSNNPLRSGGAYAALALKADLSALAAKANLSGGVVAADENRMLVQTKSSSYTLGASDAGKITWLDAASNMTITIPRDATYNFPIGTEMEFVRGSTGTIYFATQSGGTLLSKGAVYAISTQFDYASVVKVANNIWLLKHS